MTSNRFYDEHIYQHNLDLLSKTNAIASYRLQFLWDSRTLSLGETLAGEPNLYRKRYNDTDYYHAQTGAMAEIAALIGPDQIDLDSVDVIFFYGLGLGYIYDALLDWLRKSPRRQLVILEDDLEVIDFFLHTQRASQFLEDPQTTLFYFSDLIQDINAFNELHFNFINRNIHFLALPRYAQKKELDALTLCYTILQNNSLFSGLSNEYLTGQAAYYSNFYRNLLDLPRSHLGNELFGCFKNTPAIICGAGPSLHKNLSLLPSLREKALIFAGGSSLNILDNAGISPHFGVGVDPNKEQIHRLITNNSFHLPFFYRPRFSHDALNLVFGPRLYVPGVIMPLPAWIEKQLGIPVMSIDEGHNVVNLSTEIAYRLGCNPIIYVGMDLAFTETKSYGTGINVHPLWIEEQNPYHPTGSTYVFRKDIYGQNINTKWDWIAESTWLSSFAKTHPDVMMINSTEGGIGFDSVQNMKLQMTIELFLNQVTNLPDLIHTLIQNHPINIKQPQIFSVISLIKTSISKCVELIERVIKEKTEQIPRQPDHAPLDFYTPQTILAEAELQSEVGYSQFLYQFEAFLTFLQHSSKHIQNISKDNFEENLIRFQFLESVALKNIDLIIYAVKEFISDPPPIASAVPTYPNPLIPEGLYGISEVELIIEDTSLQINLHEKILDPGLLKKKLLHYPNNVLMEESYYYGNQLHGSSRFYTPQGRLLTESWFYYGKKLGKSLQYYPSGKLYSLTRYKDDLAEGVHEYFHENGAPYITLPFVQGRLNGTVFIQTIYGKPVREINYLNGKRDGVEKLWHPNGQLNFECHYREGVPIGEVCEWAPAGWVYKQASIHKFPNDFDLTVTNKEGTLLRSFQHGKEDFSHVYEKTESKIEEVTDSLKTLLTSIQPYINEEKPIPDGISAQVSEQLDQLKVSLNKVGSLRDHLTTLKNEYYENRDLENKKKDP